MSRVFIDFSISRVKSGHAVNVLCPYCKKYLKTFDALRKHLTRNHHDECGIAQVKSQASKLWKMYRGANY